MNIRVNQIEDKKSKQRLHDKTSGKGYIVFIFLIFLPCIELFSQEAYFNWIGSIIEKDGAKKISYATVRLFSDDRVFVFVANDEGIINIKYHRPTSSDSILVTSIGYKALRLFSRELHEMTEIQLEEDIYSLSEIVVTPSKRRRVRTTRLGNRALMPFSTYIGTIADTKQGLLIKYEETNGRISKVRYYLSGDVNRENRHLRPFRVMINAMDTLNNMPGMDLLAEHLIVTPNNRSDGWFEIDVSHFNIELPPKGVFVGIETFSEEYYLSNNIITTHTDKNGFPISITSIGSTSRSTKSEPSYATWIFSRNSRIPVPTGWRRISYGGQDMLINIVVELK